MPSQRHPWGHPERDSYADMNYLLCEGAICRYVIAAYHLRDCPWVVEIGGFKTPITRFLTHQPREVLVVDPLMEPFHSDELRGKPCVVDHVATTFQEHEFELPAGEYGLVLLGLSAKYFDENQQRRMREMDKLKALVANARIVILEHAVEWQTGRELAEGLLSEIDHDTLVSVDLDLKQSPGMDTEHFLRRLRVVKPRRTG